MPTDYRGALCKAVSSGECTTVSGMMDHLGISDRMAEFIVGKLVKDGALTRNADMLSIKSVAQVNALARNAPARATIEQSPHAAEPEHDIPKFVPPRVSSTPVIPIGNVEFVPLPIAVPSSGVGEAVAVKPSIGRLGPPRPKVKVELKDVLDTAVAVLDDVPKPPRPHNQVGRWPFAKMKPGQCFKVRVPDGYTALEVSRFIHKDIGNFKARLAHKGQQFSIRTLDEKTLGVWRDPDLAAGGEQGVTDHG